MDSKQPKSILKKLCTNLRIIQRIEKVKQYLEDFDDYIQHCMDECHMLLELHKKKTKSNDETRASTSNTEN